MKHTAIIADDEPLIRERIAWLLSQEPDLEVLAECGQGLETLEAIRKHRPDIVFLDIQMPAMDGFEVLNEVKEGEVKVVVFITAYDHYAVKAFSYGAVDYLLKPFNQKRFQQCVQRAKQHLDAFHGQPYRKSPPLLVREAGQYRLVDTADILYVQADGNYVLLHTRAETYRVRNTLKKLEVVLESSFARIHHSHLINLSQIRRFEHIYRGDYFFFLGEGEKKVPSSHSYRETVKKVLAELKG